MHKHNLILMIIVSFFLSFIFNIQFTSQEVYAQSEDEVSETVDIERVQTLLDRAKLHLKRGRLINAQTTLNLLLEKVDKENIDAQMLLVEIYMKRMPYLDHETEKSLKDKITKYLSIAFEKDPDNLNYNMIAAKFYRDSFDLNNAIKYARKVIVAEPENFDALLILADSNLYNGNQTEALKFYEKAQKIQPNNADVLIALLDLCDNKSEMPKIAELTEKIYKHKSIPASVKCDFCVDSAISAFNTNYKLAQKFMQYAIELQPRLNFRLMKSAMIYDAAKTDLETKLKFIEAARVDISAENSIREIKDISEKIVPEVNVLNAILFYHIDEFEKAYESIKKAKAFDTNEFPEFKEYEAYIAEKNDDLNLTLECFKTLKEREPEVTLYQTKVAMLERMQTLLSELNDATDEKKLTVKLFTGYRLYFNNWLDSSKSKDEKLAGFTKALETDAKNPWIAKEKGFLELNYAFDYKKAYQTYKIAYLGLSTDPSIMLNLAISGMLDETNKDYSLAEELLRKLTQKYPNDFIYKKYNEILRAIKDGTIKVKAYALYYQSAYTSDLATRLATCEKAYRAQENLFEPLLLWGKINMDSAKRIEQELRQLAPNSDEYAVNKARIAELQKIAEESIKLAVENARIEEQRYEALLELAELQSNTKRTENALITLNPIVNSQKPSSDALLLALGLNLQLNRNIEAHLNAAKLISLYPDHPFVSFENNRAYYEIDKTKYVATDTETKKENIKPKFVAGKAYRYHINLELQGWSGENTKMNLEFRIETKVVEVLAPGFYKLEFEVLCIRGTDVFDALFDKTYIVEMSDILGICSFVPKNKNEKMDNRLLSRFLGFVMPYITEMYAYAPSNTLVKTGDTWVKRTQGGMLHFSDSNEASFVAKSDEETTKIVRLIKSGNEVRGELADFASELIFDKNKNIATEMTFEYWSLIPDSLDGTMLDRIEAKTSGSIKLTSIK